MTYNGSFKIADANRAFLQRAHGHFIEGELTPGEGTRSWCVRDPSTEDVIAEVPLASQADVELAVRSARQAFDDGRWRHMAPTARERILLKFADLIERDADNLAELETLEQGKSLAIARYVEVAGGVDFARYAAGLATKITGMTFDVSIPTPPGLRSTAYTRREPVGVVAGIVPWNFPFAIAIWKIFPALAAGCSVVLKPTELTPLTAIRLAELAFEAGVPAGILNVIIGDGEAGSALVASNDVAKISFTGSTATGKAIAKVAADRMARVSLELGGKNPAVVLDDADLEQTVGGLMLGAFLNQGQVCCSASRVYVTAGLFDRVVAGLEGAVKSLTLGAGLDPNAQVNPLVSAQHRDRVLQFLSEADGKAELLHGAQVPDRGYFVAPTVVVNAEASLRLTHEEVFGPVLTVTRVADAEEAIRRANDNSYGLAASLWTRDLKACLDIVPQLHAGTVWVNTHIPLDPALPFGGFKQSGNAREFGPRWAEAYTEEKSVCIVH